MTFETLTVRKEGPVVFADIASPPMNLLGPALVRDLVDLILQTEGDDEARVLVFRSTDPEYFIPHVELGRTAEYRAAAERLTGEPSLGMMFRRLSESRLVTIAQIEGRIGGAGSEFALALDMRFAARETAVFTHMEVALGAILGAGGIQHLTREMGRARALEVMLSAADFDADLAERYGWINRALPAAELGAFVSALAHRIARFPPAGVAATRARVNDIALAPADDFRRDIELFFQALSQPQAQARIRDAFSKGFSDRQAEKGLARILGELSDA